MRIWKTASLAATALLLCAASCPEIKVTPIAQGTTSGITVRKFAMIQNADTWRNLWSQHTSNITPPPSLPSVNFKKESVIAIFDGQRNTGGYSIAVGKIEFTKPDTIKVQINAKSPPPGSLAADQITSPFDILRINVLPKKAEFVTR